MLCAPRQPLFGFVPAPDRCSSPRRRDEGLAASCRDSAYRICAPGQVIPVRHACPSPSRSALSPVSLPRGARPAGLGWANLAESRLRLDRLPATAAFRFFPCRATPRMARGRGDGIPRGKQKNVRPAVLRCAPALRLTPRVRFDRPRPVDRHRGRDRRGPTSSRRVRWRLSAASRSPRTATMPAR